jgi:hypothetical protein
MKKTKNNARITEIDRQEIEIKEINMKITYRLISSMELYFISVETEEEHITVYAGADETDAKKLFESFVIGKVTPCTAEDIARDFMAIK